MSDIPAGLSRKLFLDGLAEFEESRAALGPISGYARPTLTAWIRANPQAVEKAVRAMYEAEMKRWTIEGGGDSIPGAPAQSAAIRKQQLGRRSA